MSYQIVDYLRDGRLGLVLRNFEPKERRVHLVYDQQGRLALKLRAFGDFVAPRLRERLAAIDIGGLDPQEG